MQPMTQQQLSYQELDISIKMKHFVILILL